MKRARYQHGTVSLSPRSQGPDVWVYRWRERTPQGKSVRKSLVIGTRDKFKTKTQALKAAERYRLRANRPDAAGREFTFGALIERFIVEERIRESKERKRWLGLVEEDEHFDVEALEYSTASSYLSMLDMHIRPRWGNAP